MDTPFCIGMTAEDRRNYAAFLAGQYVEHDDDSDDSDDGNNEEEQ